ncbi:hypothetical protein [Sphingomonas sp.]|uniref:hypothetical protein n=1 Tax=Sphingomonas sp. TaxID=28214 RepID=UPI00307D3049
MIQGYLLGGVALLGVAGTVGGYLFGRSDGTAIEQAAQARADQAVAKDREEREGEVTKGEEAGQVAEVARSTQTKEVYREIERVIPGDPVYVDRCLTADGVRALDRAVGIANGAGAGEPVGEATGSAAGPPQP